ncbi:MAG: hypothetical protein ACE5I7_19515 [Candidatus Binatia bacterium]
MTRRGVSRQRWTWLLAAGMALFMALVVYRSFHVAGYRCSVCITYREHSACRTVEGPTAQEARRGAVTNVCAQLASGVTDSMACERLQPTKVNCRALN